MEQEQPGEAHVEQNEPRRSLPPAGMARIAAIRAMLARLEEEAPPWRRQIFALRSLFFGFSCLFYLLLIFYPIFSLNLLQGQIPELLLPLLLLAIFVATVSIHYHFSQRRYAGHKCHLPSNLRFQGTVVNSRAAWQLLLDGLSGSGLAEQLIRNDFDDPALQLPLREQLKLIANDLLSHTALGLQSRGRREQIMGMLSWPVASLFITAFAWQLPWYLCLLIAGLATLPGLVDMYVLQRYRFLFYLPALEEYLNTVLDWYEQQGSLAAPEHGSTDVPREVFIASGMDKLLRVASLLRNELARRAHPWLQEMPGFALFAALYPLLMLLIFGSIFLFLRGHLAGLGFVLAMSGLGLYLWLGLPGQLRRARQARLARRRREIRMRGLLEQVATGTLPVDELHSASPAWLHGMLNSPQRPADINLPGGELCWSLMWNLQWYLSQGSSSFRPDWPASVLAALISMSVPLAITLSPLAIFGSGFGSLAGLGIAQILLLGCLAALLLLLQYYCLRILLWHYWDAWAVVEALENLTEEE